MRTLCLHFAEDESGVTALEYSLIGALISVVIITAATAIGTSLQVIFTSIATALLVP